MSTATRPDSGDDCPCGCGLTAAALAESVDAMSVATASAVRSRSLDDVLDAARLVGIVRDHLEHRALVSDHNSLMWDLIVAPLGVDLVSDPAALRQDILDFVEEHGLIRPGESVREAAHRLTGVAL